MKTAFVKYFLYFALALVPAVASAQAKVYTKSARLADFPNKTTKVVLTGQPVLDALLKEEFTSRWRISPYEFCTAEEFGAQKSATLYYFIHFVQDSEFTYMHLTKGGPESGKNSLQNAMEVVQIPISAAGVPSSGELVFLPAYIDMVQEYVQKAMVTDRAAYGGLKSIVRRSTRGKTVCRDEEEGRELFLQQAPDTVVPVTILPAPGSRRPHAYKMKVSTDTHLLYKFRKVRL